MDILWRPLWIQVTSLSVVSLSPQPGQLCYLPVRTVLHWVLANKLGFLFDFKTYSCLSNFLYMPYLASWISRVSVKKKKKTERKRDFSTGLLCARTYKPCMGFIFKIKRLPLKASDNLYTVTFALNTSACFLIRTHRAALCVCEWVILCVFILGFSLENLQYSNGYLLK